MGARPSLDFTPCPSKSLVRSIFLSSNLPLLNPPRAPVIFNHYRTSATLPCRDCATRATLHRPAFMRSSRPRSCRLPLACFGGCGSASLSSPTISPKHTAQRWNGFRVTDDPSRYLSGPLLLLSVGFGSGAYGHLSTRCSHAQLDLWHGSTKLDKLQLESVSRSHWVFRSHLRAAQIPVGAVLKVRYICYEMLTRAYSVVRLCVLYSLLNVCPFRVLQAKETRQEALSNRYKRLTSIQHWCVPVHGHGCFDSRHVYMRILSVFRSTSFTDYLLLLMSFKPPTKTCADSSLSPCVRSAKSASLFSGTDSSLDADLDQCPVGQDEAFIRRQSSFERPGETVMHVMNLSLAECREPTEKRCTFAGPMHDAAHWRWREGQYLLGPPLAAYSPAEVLVAGRHHVHIVSSCDRGSDSLAVYQDNTSRVACFSRCRVWLDIPSTFWTCNSDFDFSSNDPSKKHQVFLSRDPLSQRAKSLSALGTTKKRKSMKLFESYAARPSNRKSFKQFPAQNAGVDVHEQLRASKGKTAEPVQSSREEMLQALSGTVQVTFCSLCCVPGCCAPGQLAVSVATTRRTYCNYHLTLRTQSNDQATRLSAEQASEYPPVDCQLKARAVPQCFGVTPLCAPPDAKSSTNPSRQTALAPRAASDPLKPLKLVAKVASCSLYSLGQQLPSRVLEQASLRGFTSVLRSHSPFFLVVVQVGNARWTVRRCYTYAGGIRLAYGCAVTINVL